MALFLLEEFSILVAAYTQCSYDSVNVQIVMLNSRTVENIKEFIVQTISNMIKARASNIKSGWKIVFNILNGAATSIPKDIPSNVVFTRCRIALDVIELILQDYFWVAVEHFGEVIRCLVSFGLLHLDSYGASNEEKMTQLPIKVNF